MPLSAGIYKVKVLANTATLTGTWDRVVPLPVVLGCSSSEWATALANGGFGSCQLQAASSPVTGYTFGGADQLTGGNPWDGTYTNINDLPIKGITPVTQVQLVGTFYCSSGFPAANTVGVGVNAPYTDAIYSFNTGPVTNNIIAGISPVPTFSNMMAIKMGASISCTPPQLSLLDLYFTGQYIVYSYNTGIDNGISIAAPHSQTGKAFTRSFITDAGNEDNKLKIRSGALYGATTPSNSGLNLSTSGITGILFSWSDPTTGAFTTLHISSGSFENLSSTGLDIDTSLLTGLPDGVWITIWIEGTTLPDLANPYTGTTFSGSVSLGLLMILGTTGSGIYRIVPGQHHDTIYINNPTDASTADFAIPTPYGRTGYIGG